MSKSSSHQKSRKGGTRGTLFRDVAIRHLKSAGVLLANKCEHDAIYLGGYAIECMLKYAVTCNRRLVYLPAELETHDLDILLVASGLEQALKKDTNLHAAYSALADDWGPVVRYQAPTLAKGKADLLYKHIVQLYKWLFEQVS